MNTIETTTSCEEAIRSFWRSLSNEQKTALGKDIALQINFAGSSYGLIDIVKSHVAGMGLFSDPAETFADVFATYIALPDAAKKDIRDRLAAYFLEHNTTELRPEKAWDYKEPQLGVLLNQAPVAAQPGRLDITTPTTIPPLLHTEVPPKETPRH